MCVRLPAAKRVLRIPVTPDSEHKVQVNVTVLLMQKYLVLISIRIYCCWTTKVVLEVR